MKKKNRKIISISFSTVKNEDSNRHRWNEIKNFESNFKLISESNELDRYSECRTWWCAAHHTYTPIKQTNHILNIGKKSILWIKINQMTYRFNLCWVNSVLVWEMSLMFCHVQPHSPTPTFGWTHTHTFDGCVRIWVGTITTTTTAFILNLCSHNFSKSFQSSLMEPMGNKRKSKE